MFIKIYLQRSDVLSVTRFVVAFPHLHVGCSCWCTSQRRGLGPGKRGLPPRNDARVQEAPRCPALPLADGGDRSQLPPWLWHNIPHTRSKGHQLQSTKEKHEKGNLRLNITIPGKYGSRDDTASYLSASTPARAGEGWSPG